MPRLTWCLLGFVLVGMVAGAAEDQPLQLYVQLIRATNNERPASPDWKAAGPRVKACLSPAFGWKNYWQVSLQEVSVQHGKATKASLTPGRRLEINRVGDNVIELRLFHREQLSRSIRHPLSRKMAITGWEIERKEAGFVVVRREKPQ